MSLLFLKSERFWKLFLVGILTGLEVVFPGNIYLVAIATVFQVWFGSSVAVRTVDRFGEQRARQ